MNTRRDFLNCSLGVIAGIGAVEYVQAHQVNDVFVIDDSLDYTVTQWVGGRGITVHLMSDINLRKEVAAWLSNDTPKVYYDGEEFGILAIALTPDRVVLGLTRL